MAIAADVGSLMMILGSVFTSGAALYHTSYPTPSAIMHQIIPTPVETSSYSTRRKKLFILAWMVELLTIVEGSLSP